MTAGRHERTAIPKMRGARTWVIRLDPRNPREVRQSREEITRQEVPEEGGRASVGEEALATDATTASGTCILGLMKGVEKSAVDQVGWPD